MNKIKILNLKNKAKYLKAKFQREINVIGIKSYLLIQEFIMFSSEKNRK